jgi:lipopolysaccharide export system ATP-binding protein
MGIIKRFRIKNFKEKNILLQLDRISMFYDKRRILNNISLSVNQSEIVGLLGPNGAGKSTIMKIIMGIEHQKSGKIYLNGTDCSNLPIHERAKYYNVSICPQFAGYFFDLTVLENLTSVAEIHIKEKNLRISKIDQIVNQFGLEAVLNTKAKICSGGERKKLSIAMAIINDPEILLLDEPYAFLDILSVKMIQEIIINLQSLKNMSIIVTDHNAADLLKTVDRCLVLANTKIIASGSPNDIIRDSNAITAYFGKDFKIN